MSSLSEFLHMGGYGFFVWTAYGIWAAVMLWNSIVPWMRHREVTRELINRLRAQELDTGDGPTKGFRS